MTRSQTFPARFSEEVDRRGGRRQRRAVLQLEPAGVRQRLGERSAADRLHRHGQHGHAATPANMPSFGDIVAVCDVDSRHAERAKNDAQDRQGQGRRLRRLPQGARPQGHRRGEHRHARPLAREDRHRGPAGRQARLLPEAADADARREPTDPQRLQEVRRAGVPRRHAAAERRGPVPPRRQHGAEGAAWATSRRSPSASTAARRGGPFPKVAPPKELDWDIWLGQAPKVDYIEERCHYEFRWWYEYSGGKFTDWGAHHIDIATWAIGHDQEGMGPIEIDGTDAKHPVPFKDGYPTVDDCYNTSHDFAVKCKFANGIEMIVDQPQRQRHPLRGHEGPHLRQPRQDHRQADRGEVGQGQVRAGRPGAALQGQAVRRPQGQLLPLHPRGRTARLRRLQPRPDDEHLPSLRDCRAAGPRDQVGPEGREDHRRRPGRRLLRPHSRGRDSRFPGCRRPQVGIRALQGSGVGGSGARRLALARTNQLCEVLTS